MMCWSIPKANTKEQNSKGGISLEKKCPKCIRCIENRKNQLHSRKNCMKKEPRMRRCKLQSYLTGYTEQKNLTQLNLAQKHKVKQGLGCETSHQCQAKNSPVMVLQHKKEKIKQVQLNSKFIQQECNLAYSGMPKNIDMHTDIT